jgi:hypothetical protein
MEHSHIGAASCGNGDTPRLNRLRQSIAALARTGARSVSDRDQPLVERELSHDEIDAVAGGSNVSKYLYDSPYLAILAVRQGPHPLTGKVPTRVGALTESKLSRASQVSTPFPL